MAKRGRPRHPDILTPREWDVLALVREGLTNEQIAERLEITERTARFHVSEILRKLGVSSRHEAAAWSASGGEERRPWWSFAIAPLSFGKAHRWLATVVASATIAVGVAGVALLVWGISRTEARCPTPGTGNAEVDYLDMVRFNDIRYVSQGPLDSRVHLGPKFATVQCSLVGVNDSSYRMRNGDATGLAPDTPLYLLDGYAPTFRLTARAGDQFFLYEAYENPEARIGRDLFAGMEGKVQFIRINTDYPQQVTEIRDEATVQHLVSLLMDAPASASSVDAAKGQQSFVRFHLNDGTFVGRSFWAETGRMAPGLRLPREFGDAVLEALRSSP
jgi:DNA-binding CsgD family transcriptional regulator